MLIKKCFKNLETQLEPGTYFLQLIKGKVYQVVEKGTWFMDDFRILASEVKWSDAIDDIIILPERIRLALGVQIKFHNNTLSLINLCQNFKPLSKTKAIKFVREYASKTKS